MESRKIQKVGAATLTISLPKDWITRRNVRKGDQIFILEEGDSLRILTGPGMEDRKRKFESYVIDADLCTEPGFLERTIVGNYILGRQKIVVRSATRIDPDRMEEVRDAARRLLGLAIIEETRSMITLQCAVNPADYPLDALIRRLYNLSTTMLGESVEALLTGDRQLAEDVIKRESDADMMYWLIVRLVLSAQTDEGLIGSLGLHSRLDIPGYRAMARDLENVADFCERIARAAITLIDSKAEISPSVAKLLKTLADSVMDVYAKAIAASLGGDIRQANEAIAQQKAFAARESELMKLFLKEYEDPTVLIPLRMVLRGIVEMSECADSIALIAFNRYLEQPTTLNRPAAPEP